VLILKLHPDYDSIRHSWLHNWQVQGICERLPKGDVFIMEDNVALMQSLQQKPASVSINLQTSQLTAMLVALLNSKHNSLILYRIWDTAVAMKSSVFCWLSASCWFFAWHILQPWSWSWHVPPKCQLTFSRLCAVISQKTELFSLIVIYWNITCHSFVMDIRMQNIFGQDEMAPFTRTEHRSACCSVSSGSTTWMHWAHIFKKLSYL
jgi:hypothetical protein